MSHLAGMETSYAGAEKWRCRKNILLGLIIRKKTCAKEKADFRRSHRATKVRKVRNSVTRLSKMLQDARMADLVKLRCGN
jgi:hypothetical protein